MQRKHPVNPLRRNTSTLLLCNLITPFLRSAGAQASKLVALGYLVALLPCILALPLHAQTLPTDGELTLRPILQQLGQRLLNGKNGSIVAIRPETGEVICLATNSDHGFDTGMAIAKAYAPGSTFKTAQALAMLTEGGYKLR